MPTGMFERRAGLGGTLDNDGSKDTISLAAIYRS